jgi:hypothetical protein
MTCNAIPVIALRQERRRALLDIKTTQVGQASTSDPRLLTPGHNTTTIGNPAGIFIIMAMLMTLKIGLLSLAASVGEAVPTYWQAARRQDTGFIWTQKFFVL